MEMTMLQMLLVLLVLAKWKTVTHCWLKCAVRLRETSSVYNMVRQKNSKW